MTTSDFAAYIDSLPKILAGASTLFRDADGRILIAETTYREDGKWVLPGGTIESSDGETPREGARRETLEEIGLDVEPGDLLVIDWVQGMGRMPLASFLFDGGVLDDASLAAVRLQAEELSDWRMATPDEAEAYLSPGLYRRVRAALAVVGTVSAPVELVNGLPPRPRT
ncbi:NUDIX domain-containing protein [Streptomyces sp. NPDC088354]|uniref:NUDIX hydrolase n=1 Tax=unclassified Streptomyces TaxID=2593676 RepID=UPI0029BD5292|nr:NUDIX hydrolase [Streptomyces sp. MI02-7b]MDX3077528.1 NUDIX hydrolase [Streptomyces sp. MI02-7b]